MGTFRTLLALAVVLFHSGGYEGYDITGGSVSVQSFFIISGFYMSFILSEKYVDQNGALFLFYTNRFYRLFPVYYFFFFIKLCLSIISVKLHWYPYQGWTLNQYIVYFDRLNPTTLLFLLFTNLMIFFQDTCLFLSLNLKTGMLYFSKYEWLAQPSVWYFNFIPQAWTLSIEIYFYIIAPFIVRRRISTILAMLFISFALRYYLYSNGFRYVWWTYSFFPMELSLFLMGSLSYRLFSMIKKKNNTNSKRSFRVWVFVMIATLCYPLFPKTATIPNFFSDSNIIFYFLISITLPFLFLFSQNNKIDQFIGELSYPIYLCHLIIIPFFSAPLEKGKSILTLFLIVGLSFVLSIATLAIIIRPIDRYRQKRVERYRSP